MFADDVVVESKIMRHSGAHRHLSISDWALNMAGVGLKTDW